MKQNRVHGGQAKQFSCDDVARIVASAVNKVLSELKVQYIVEGTAVFSAENSIFLVDIVICDIQAQETRGVLITIPPLKEVTDGYDQLE